MENSPGRDTPERNRNMDIRSDINPHCFTFDRSFWEAAMKMGDEDRLSFYDGLCKLAFERKVPDEPENPFSPLSVALTLALPMVETSCAKAVGGLRGGRPRKA